MTTVIANLKVKDYNSWKAKYDAHKPQIANIVELAVGEKAGKPGDVYMIMQMEHPDVLNNMIADKNMRNSFTQAMESTGVISVNEITFIN